MAREPLIAKHGGFRQLKTFRLARLVYDVTVRFADRHIERRSRTHDQMVQAARSGVQNIAEGSEASATSRKMELKLTNVARASLAELKLDFEDYLRQRGHAQWRADEPLRRELVTRRPDTADAVKQWVEEILVRSMASIKSIESMDAKDPMARSPARTGELKAALAANAALVLIEVTMALLARQIAAQADAFERQGGFSERLYRTRQAYRHSD